MKRIAEGKPVVGITEVTHPVEVRLAVRVVPPHVTGLLVAIERFV